MKKYVLLTLLGVAAVACADAQTRPTNPTTPPAAGDTTRRAGGVALPGAAKAQPKPYAQVITDKAVTRKGMITTHKLDDKFFFEISDTTLGRDILVVSRISRAG